MATDALCGAVALAIHGAPRGTKDIDVLLREDDLPRLRDVARKQGFDIEALPMTFSSSGVTPLPACGRAKARPKPKPRTKR